LPNKYLYAKSLIGLCLILLLLPFGNAGAASMISWGAVQTGTYDSPSMYTLNWSGNVLDKGGLNLARKQMTGAAEADVVIDYKGSIGASAIAVVDDETFEASTSIAGLRFSNTQKIGQGTIYVIQLHDGKYAKLRIDRYNEDYSGAITKVFFSYAIETASGNTPEPNNPKPNTPEPEAPKPETPKPTEGTTVLGDPKNDLEQAVEVYQVEEGPIVLPFKAVSGAQFDVYRSDNGEPYVRMNDFALDKPEFTEHYAFAGHTYVYRLAAYDESGKFVYSNPVVYKVIKKVSLSTRTIELSMGSRQATVNGKPHTLDAAPMTLNYRTMVPLRFIGEAIGAKVDWNGATREITIVHEGQTITLGIDNSVATVNGKTVVMDAPATSIQGITMVPVRFVSENLKQEVAFDNKTRKITITGHGHSGGTEEKPNEPDPAQETPPETKPPEEQQPEKPADPADPADPANPQDPNLPFVGTWELWIPGVGTDVPGSGQGTFTPGTAGGRLVIRADSTWQYTLGKNVFKGSWGPAEVQGEITLANFQYGADWNVRFNRGVFQVYTFGMYYEGTKQ